MRPFRHEKSVVTFNYDESPGDWQPPTIPVTPLAGRPGHTCGLVSRSGRFQQFPILGRSRMVQADETLPSAHAGADQRSPQRAV